jgi:hypothetical protein
MYIEGHDHMGQPFRVKLSRALVYDDYGNIVGAIVKYTKGAMYIGHVGEAGFEDYLLALGLRTASIVDTIDLKALPPIKD